MRRYVWDEEKTGKLKAECGVSFEEVVFFIESGCILDVIGHSGRKYSIQKIYVIEIGGYVYMASLVKEKSVTVFKTIMPSHKITKTYLEK